MTREEANAFRVFVAEWREFREDDRAWKSDVGERLQTVEEFAIGEKAVREREAARGVSRRSYIASAIAAIGVIASIALGLWNLLS